MRVIELPGHSIDSVCFLLGEMLFTGDILSAGAIGTTRDGYARGLLLSTVRRRLLPLGDEVLVFPGHGPPSKIGIEKLYNPFPRREALINPMARRSDREGPGGRAEQARRATLPGREIRRLHAWSMSVASGSRGSLRAVQRVAEDRSAAWRMCTRS